MGLSTVGGGNVRVRHGLGGDVHPPLPKSYSPIYCDSYNIVVVSGDVESTGSAGGQHRWELTILHYQEIMLI